MMDDVGVVDALRLQGAHQVDPVGFHYIEVLSQRASAHQGRVKQLLEEKLETAAAALLKRLPQKPDLSTDFVEPIGEAHRETLGDLVRLLAEQSLDRPDGRMEASLTAPRTELKSVRYFRNTWSKLSAERQLAQALGQAPKNAGPINSHVVALRSLALMRDTSPDYLNRFLAYADTLLCLEQGDRPQQAPAKAPRAAKAKRQV